MDSEESYHSESDFYYPDEMTNDIEKQNVVTLGNEKNQHEFEVFTMVNVQNYILEPNERENRVRLERLEEVFS